ncbi:MAG TPA: trehalase family glycosidase [Candidatus Saccharimonadales bacterium]|nr:trehalase family glycosidase [Candidatus Saccharimonadales bacterium]
MRVRLNKKDNQHHKIDEELLNQALDYIDDYWPKLIRENKTDRNSLIGLPYPYIVPSDDEHENYAHEAQYYWDTYFTALGLSDKSHEALVIGMLENLILLFKRFGTIPNASRTYFTGRSQPPILTTIIFYIYETFDKSDQWLIDYMNIARQEYEQVWMSDQHPVWHRVHHNLSRYYDVNVLHDLAEAESGWDMTPRFERKCLDYLPVDLNALLYKYEVDFARCSLIAGSHKQAEAWRALAADRQAAMNELMWGKLRGFYFDYNYQKKELGTVWSLAGFYPMWAGMVTPEQADKLVTNLAKFERAGGLTTTTRPLIDMTMFGSLKTQWAYPNGWAPLHFIVVEGLRRYGYTDAADRISKKWLTTNLNWFNKHNQFMEKYNVVNWSKSPGDGVYPNQTGFGWTNGVFVHLAKQLSQS